MIRISRLQKDPGKPEIIICNHQSWLDIPCLLALLPHPFRFIADDSVFRIPLFGLALRLAGCVRVTRHSLRAPLSTLDRAAEALQSGTSVLIFPEGGINRTAHPEKLIRVHLGFVRLAIRTGTPVRPVAICNLDLVRNATITRRDRVGCLVMRTTLEFSEQHIRDKTALRRQIERVHYNGFSLLNRLLQERLVEGGGRYPSLPDLFSLFYWKRNRFTPAQTRRVNSDLAVIRSGDGNIWLFNHQGGWFAVDSGYQKTNTGSVLASLGIAPDLVSAVFLTHADYDHAGGLRVFPAAEIFAHKKEQPLLERQKSRWGGVYFTPKTKRDIRYFDEKNASTILQGFPLQPLPLAGHTPGHCGYLVLDRYLCTGDSIRIKGTKIIPFFSLLNHSNKKAVASAARVEELAAGRLLCTGHSGLIPGQRIRKIH